MRPLPWFYRRLHQLTRSDRTKLLWWWRVSRAAIRTEPDRTSNTESPSQIFFLIFIAANEKVYCQLFEFSLLGFVLTISKVAKIVVVLKKIASVSQSSSVGRKHVCQRLRTCFRFPPWFLGFCNRKLELIRTRAFSLLSKKTVLLFIEWNYHFLLFCKISIHYVSPFSVVKIWLKTVIGILFTATETSFSVDRLFV